MGRGYKELPRQFLSEHRGIAGKGEPGFQIDHAVLHQLSDLAVEMLHAIGSAGLHGVERVLFSRSPFSMHSRVRALALRISKAATRPLRSSFGISRWQMM